MDAIKAQEIAVKAQSNSKLFFALQNAYDIIIKEANEGCFFCNIRLQDNCGFEIETFMNILKSKGYSVSIQESQEEHCNYAFLITVSF